MTEIRLLGYFKQPKLPNSNLREITPPINSANVKRRFNLSAEYYKYIKHDKYYKY